MTMTMRSHLEDDMLLDVIFGAASVEAARHAEECAECARRIADARAGLAMAADAEAPEPSPLFWNAFRRRVASAIEAEPRPRRFGGLFVPGLLAAAAMVAVVTFLPHEPGAPVVSPAPLAASSALPAAEDATDAATASADELAECRDVAACVASLTDEESRALADALRAELGQSGDL
jgi:hypothetical protein